MKIFVLEWLWSDGYDHSNSVIGVYSSQAAAEGAYAEWLGNTAEYGMEDGYEMQITEMVLEGTG